MALANALKHASQLPKHIAERRTAMPLFFAFCPDYPGAISNRLKVRAEHLARAKQDHESGVIELGRPFLPPPDAPQNDVDLPEGTPQMGGSVMMFRLPSRDAAWSRIKEDVYWTGNVWNKEELRIEQFCAIPGEK